MKTTAKVVVGVVVFIALFLLAMACFWPFSMVNPACSGSAIITNETSDTQEAPTPEEEEEPPSEEETVEPPPSGTLCLGFNYQGEGHTLDVCYDLDCPGTEKRCRPDTDSGLCICSDGCDEHERMPLGDESVCTLGRWCFTSREQCEWYDYSPAESVCACPGTGPYTD